MKVHLISKTNLTFITVFGILLLFLLTVFFAASQNKASALSTDDFNAGRIIDDTVFYNKSSMDVQQIQDFLNKLIPNCDTWGTGQSEYGGGTRAQYAISRGWQGPPYACLNNYHENPQTNETSYEKGGGAFEGGVSAAQIIYNAAQQYGINPQVLLVLLKKESAGPLTADSWPLKSQYRYAMGYGCPDSGPGYSANCDSEKAGFYKQLTTAAWQLKYYKDHPNDYRYKIGSNQIQYSPDPACGTKSVHIENIATLSLYIYTPYTPNNTALANYPGEAPCGAYGNRNFFMYFKEWFGSPNYRPPTCDVKASNVTCVWRLYDPEYTSDFLTTNNQERDTAVISSRYSYENNAFYAFTSQKSGTIPVYRIRLPERHFYTANEAEKDSLIQNSLNKFEGVAFYAYPSTTSTNASHPVYRLNSGQGHVLTSSTVERDLLLSNGYTYEGLAFNTPSGFASTTLPSENRVNIYRLSNDKRHLYTKDLSETDNLIKSGWKYEGILQEAPSTETSTPVYRLFNGTHIFSSLSKERDELIKSGWKYEGVSWYIDSQNTQVYRFYINNHHFYTSSLNEAMSITNRGANYEGVAFGYSQNSSVPVYRFYDGARHFLTANINEALTIANTSWRYEGVAWQSNTQGTAVYRLKGPYHFYTANTTERDALVNSGWKYEGVAWLTNQGTPIYRIKGPYHFYTANTTERDALVNSGWKYEGVAWQ